MASPLVTRTAHYAVEHVPGLRRIPVVTLIAIAEVGLIARDHVMYLTPNERRRLLTLIRVATGRHSHLTQTERNEMARLVAKLEPRMLAGEAVHRLSPIPVPRGLIEGKTSASKPRARRRKPDQSRPAGRRKPDQPRSGGRRKPAQSRSAGPR